MEDVVKCFCRQADYQFGVYNDFPSAPFCTVKKGGACTGISGYALNGKSCAFLCYHRKRRAPQYDIQWTCEDGVLLPQVIVAGQGPYIGFKASNPGVLRPQSLGRDYCPDRDDLRLKLQNIGMADFKEIESMAALWHDQFLLSSEGRDPMRSLVLMSIVEEIQSEIDVEILASVENCILLFFAPNIIFSLEKYACQNTNNDGELALLSFLSRYCQFMLDLLPLYHDRRLNAISFSRCFEDCWQVCIRDILRDLVNSSDAGQKPFKQVPVTGQTLGEALRDTLLDCVEAVTYINRVRSVKRIYKRLSHLGQNSNETTSLQLECIQNYICIMERYRHPSRAG